MQYCTSSNLCDQHIRQEKKLLLHITCIAILHSTSNQCPYGGAIPQEEGLVEESKGILIFTKIRMRMRNNKSTSILKSVGSDTVWHK